MTILLTKTAALLTVGLGCILTAAYAAPITVEMTNTSPGTVPGTAITYTISVVGDDGGPRNIFPSASSDNNVWTWPGPNPNFPEFLSFGQAETLTVTFSAPLPINHVVFGINSTSASSSTLGVAGGTAATGDFDLSDSLQVYTGPTGAASFNQSTGNITAAGQNQSIMIGSTSSNTISSFTLSAGASDGGADGYTVFVGFTSAVVPEPSQLILLGSALCFFLLRSRIRGLKRA